MKKLIAAIAVSAALLCISASAQTAALPEFDIKINGIKIENETREYPLVLYRDITYFPMTYFDSGFMGLRSEYTPDSGLSLTADNSTGLYAPHKAEKAHADLTIEKISYSVTVNGEAVDPEAAQYPLLNIKGVTYFPLTYEYVHDKFGWDISFGEDGLSVTNPGYCGVKSEYAAEASLLGEYVLLLEPGACTVLCPEGKAEISFDGARSYNFCAVGDGIYFELRSEDYSVIKSCMIFRDGSVKNTDGEFYIGGKSVAVSGDGSLIVDGREIKLDGVQFIGAASGASFGLYENTLVVCGNREGAGLPSIFAINLDNGEADEIIPRHYDGYFTVSGDKVYALTDGGEHVFLTEYSLADKSTRQITTVSEASFDVLPLYSVGEGGIYYKNGGEFYASGGYHENTPTDKLLYRVGGSAPVPGGIKPSYAIDSYGEYTVVCCEAAEAKAIVLNKDGEIVFSCCNDELNQISVSGDTVYLTQYEVDDENVASPKLYTAKLKI